MLCPNCKQELMNVNGRYICVDCGKEVPENEVPVAQAEHDGIEAKVEGNDYLYSDLPSQGNVEQSGEEDKTEETPTIPAGQVETTPATESVVSEVSQPEIVPVEVPVDSPLSEIQDTSTVEEVMQPMVSEITSQQPGLVDNVPQVETDIQSSEEKVEPKEAYENQNIDSPERPVVNVIEQEEQSVPDAGGAESLQNDNVNEPSQVPGQITNYAEPVPDEVTLPAGGINETEIGSVPTENNLTTVQPANTVSFDSLRPSQSGVISNFSQNMSQIQQEAQLDSQKAQEPAPVQEIPQESEQTTVATVGEYNFSQASHVFNDKTVYQNPMFDQQDLPEPEDKQIKEKVYQEVNRRKLIFIAVVGVIGLIVLIVAGVLIYNVLSTPAKVTPVELEETVDCGSAGANIADSETAKSCFAQYFQQCKLAKYSETLDLGTGGIIAADYKITGKTDASCTVETKYTKNPTTKYVNKKMECSLDNAKTFSEALGEIGKQNCSGPLADLMFATQNTGSN